MPQPLRSQPGCSICATPPLRAAFGIGFCILFAFIGTFTYVNFVLVREPLSLGPMALGFVYFVFLPSIVTDAVRGHVPCSASARARRSGARSALAGLGLPLLLRAAACRGDCRPDAGRRRHLLRPGGRDRLRRPRGHDRSRLGQRHLSRLLFLSAAWSAARCSDSCSMRSAGPLAFWGSRSRCW